jgi:hypothetical protein
MQQAFIAHCAALHSQAAALLAQLRCQNLAGLEGALPEEFCCLTDNLGDAAAYVSAPAGKAMAGGSTALAGKQQQLMYEPQDEQEEWAGMGDAAALLYSGGMAQCGAGGDGSRSAQPAEQQMQ